MEIKKKEINRNHRVSRKVAVCFDRLGGGRTETGEESFALGFLLRSSPFRLVLSSNALCCCVLQLCYGLSFSLSCKHLPSTPLQLVLACYYGSVCFLLCWPIAVLSSGSLLLAADALWLEFAASHSSVHPFSSLPLLFSSIYSVQSSSPSSTRCYTARLLYLYSAPSLCMVSFLQLLLPPVPSS